MDNLQPLKSFLTDLITPIVKSAVDDALPEAIKPKEKNLMPITKVSETYGMCQTKLYGLLRCGKLERYKEGGNTFIDTYELDRLMVKEELCGKAPLKMK
ncbi:MAG: hypothetical protein KBS58_03820 [Bacteroidales bacterium]|nr:hypothetical protein [Candidatus Cacconaster equi]